MSNFKIILLLFCVPLLSYSQNEITKSFSIEWNDEIKTTSSNNQIDIPLVKGQGFDQQMLPVFSEKWLINTNSSVKNFEITNIQLETFSNNNQFLKKGISGEVKASFQAVNEREKRFAGLTLTPLVRLGNTIKRVISFDIKYELKQSTTARNSSSRLPVTNSVLSTGTWHKFSIDTTGVFKIDRAFMQSLGMNLNGLNPQNIRIFGNGGNLLPERNGDFRYDDLQENAIYVEGESDGNFDSSDFALFYAKGPHSWNRNTAGELSHVTNIYSDKAFYFITIDNGPGKRIQNQAVNPNPATQQITTFNDYTFFDEEEENLFGIGRQWLGEDFSFENVHTFTIPFNNLVSTEDLQIKVRGVAESTSVTSMNIKVNGQDITPLNFTAVSTLPGNLTHAVGAVSTQTFLTTGNSVTVEITYNNAGNPSSKAHLDYIEIIGVKNLIADDSQFSFRNFNVENTNDVVEYQIQNSSNINTVWNVTDYINPTIILNESSNATYTFKASGGILNEYIAISPNDYYAPERVSENLVVNQNLHALQDIDYLIITQPYLIEQAERLAEHHRQNSNLIVKVVPLYEIYNEFGSGSPDISAIRDFIKHLYDNATVPENKIKYVCLFGDASYDYKDRVIGNNNIVPVYEAYDSFNLASSFVTDDFYGMMDANEGNLNESGLNLQDVVTGRIPVTSVEQARQVVTKLLRYYNTEAFGDWRNQITLMADDIDQINPDATLQIGMERIADDIKDNKPIFNIKKIYADSYPQQNTAGGERYPSVNTAITNAVERGVLLADYFGHGGEDGLASERIVEVFEIQSWRNEYALPLFITITCELSKFDNPLRLTAGEFLFWNKDGGAASLITTTREIYVNVGRNINEQLIKVLLNFNNENYTIAEALMKVKNIQSFGTQRYFVYSIGDPVMKLAVPKPDIRLTSMNGVPLTTSTDTIKALSHVYFEGIVTDANGTILPDFNGELSATVFDKPIDKTTLVNDGLGSPMIFDALESKIFRGRATVTNGNFAFDFIAPRDLRIAYGKGKISLYADNDVIDKAGYNFDITVGGINEDAPDDNVGPTIELYMNDESFVDGGNTNTSPLFLAVLEDENGINTSITAVDHDIIGILDGDQANPIIMNDFYQTELNDYMKGKVKYPFRNLTPGPHTIKLCAWDTYNNQSCATLNFVVISDQELVLDNVLNYPNPFVNYTQFWFNHNKPNEPLETQIQIFTVSGKLVKTINQIVETNGTLSRSITWNGLDDFGDKIGKGVYVYKLKVKSTLSNLKAEKFEKLVILQ